MRSMTTVGTDSDDAAGRRAWRVASIALLAALLVVPTALAQEGDGGDDPAQDPTTTEVKLKVATPEEPAQTPARGRSLAALAASIKLDVKAAGGKEIVITNDNLGTLGEGGLLTTASSTGASLGPLLQDEGGATSVGPQQMAAQEQRVEELRQEYQRMQELNQSVRDPYNPYSPHYRPGNVSNPLESETERIQEDLRQAEQRLEEMRRQRQRQSRP